MLKHFLFWVLLRWNLAIQVRSSSTENEPIAWVTVFAQATLHSAISAVDISMQFNLWQFWVWFKNDVICPNRIPVLQCYTNPNCHLHSIFKRSLISLTHHGPSMWSASKSDDPWSRNSRQNELEFDWMRMWVSVSVAVRGQDRLSIELLVYLIIK